MVGRLAVPVFAFVLICGGPVSLLAADPAPAAKGADVIGLSLLPWEPSKSYQGGAQFDPRLDQPVRLWRAGMPLREVLAELARQTGVRFRFATPEREEPRVCVTLFLNPQDPPSLRAVMVQLGWVTGNSFASTGEPSGRQTYSLLTPSTGPNVARTLAAERQTRQEAQGRAAGAALEESRNALALSPQEVIARYRGTNDALLLNMLEPARRAALTLVTGLPEADLKQLIGGREGRLSRDWSDWSPEQQAALQQALGLSPDQLASGNVSIVVTANRGGALIAVPPGGGGRRGRGRSLGRVSGLLASGNVRGDDEIALRRHLGQLSTPAQEEAARKAQQTARDAARDEFRQQRTQQVEQAQRAARALSPQREAQLAALPLSGDRGSGGLWQLQEMVAQATGLNVISDCFSLPTDRFGRRGQGGAAPANALQALDTACAGGFGRFGGGPGRGPAGGANQDLGVTWGEAGPFLRFRAQRPDIWRGAMLPADVQTQLDDWLEPYVKAATDAPPGASALTGDVEKLSWLAAKLDDMQVRLGGAVLYENPADPAGARRQRLRRATLMQVAMHFPVLRLLATFTPAQWARARGSGLQWGTDLTPDQQSSDLLRMAARGVPQGRENDVVLLLGQVESPSANRRDGAASDASAVPALKLMLDGNLVGQVVFSGRPQGGPGGRRGNANG